MSNPTAKKVLRPRLEVQQRVPRPLTEDEQQRVAETVAARKLTNLVGKFGKQHDPRPKPAKREFSGGLPDARPGSVNWKKQESIAVNQSSAGGRKKKASGKK